MLPGVLFNSNLILYGTETDPFPINSSFPTISPTFITSTAATEATEGPPIALSGQCLQTRYDKDIIRTVEVTNAKHNMKILSTYFLGCLSKHLLSVIS